MHAAQLRGFSAVSSFSHPAHREARAGIPPQLPPALPSVADVPKPRMLHVEHREHLGGPLVEETEQRTHRFGLDGYWYPDVLFNLPGYYGMLISCKENRAAAWKLGKGHITEQQHRGEYWVPLCQYWRRCVIRLVIQIPISRSTGCQGGLWAGMRQQSKMTPIIGRRPPLASKCEVGASVWRQRLIQSPAHPPASFARAMDHGEPLGP